MLKITVYNTDSLCDGKTVSLLAVIMELTITMILTLALSVTAWSDIRKEYPVRYIYKEVEGKTTTFIIHDGGFTFWEAKNWCDSLGGQLPTLKSDNDRSFLQNRVVPRGTPGYSPRMWLGRNPVGYVVKCNENWMDGTPVNRANYDYGCDRCADLGCCAMSLHISSGTDCETCEVYNKAICVAPGKIEPPKKEDEIHPKQDNETKKDPNQPVILAIVVSSIVSCIITCLVITVIAWKVVKSLK